MKNRSKLNNQGFSLIELIVAVLIMAIISGTAIYTFGLVFNTQASSTARKTADIIKQARTSAMGVENSYDKDTKETDVYLLFERKGSDLYASVCSMANKSAGDDPTILSEQKIGGSSISLDFIYVNGTGTETTFATVKDGSSTKVYVYYKKATGGISLVKTDTSACASGEIVNLIRVNGTGKSEDVVLVELTGRGYIK